MHYKRFNALVMLCNTPYNVLYGPMNNYKQLLFITILCHI